MLFPVELFPLPVSPIIHIILRLLDSLSESKGSNSLLLK
jgi:hypothetical protein